MKKIYSAILAMAAVLAVAGCTKEESVKLTNLGDDTVEVESAGGDVLVSFTSSAAWTATSSEEWIFIDQTSGAAGTCEIMAAVEENTTNEFRSAVITVTVGKAAFTVTVNQAQNNVFGVSTKEISAPSEASDVTFTVTGNVEYTVTSMVSWIKVASTKALETNTVTLSIEENQGAARTGGVKVKSSEGEVLVKVNQEVGITDEIGALQITYYGDYYGNGTSNWIAAFYDSSVLGMSDSEVMNVFSIDLLLDSKYTIFNMDRIPDGTYTVSDSYEAGTISEYSMMVDYVEYEFLSLVDITLVVSGDTYSCTATDENGGVHKFKWTIDEEWYFMVDGRYSSTVTDDYEVTFGTCQLNALGQYFKDDYGIETYQTQLIFSEGDPQIGVEGTAVGTEGVIILSSATEDFTGSYEVQPADEEDFSAGKLDAYNSYFYSYDEDYYYLDDGYFAVNGGTLTVSKDGDIYTIDGVITDDLPEEYGDPHKLTVHFKGALTVEEEEAAAASSVRTKRSHKLPAVGNKANKYGIRL